jgi:hypothetical protein
MRAPLGGTHNTAAAVYRVAPLNRDKNSHRPAGSAAVVA